MCKIIAVANHKGGVAKTSSTVNIGIGLARMGQKVLLVDSDAQASLTSSLGFRDPDSLKYSIATVFDRAIHGKEYDPEEGILHHEEGIDLVPSSIDLSVCEADIFKAYRCEYILKGYLNSLKKKYDWILIDCPPSLSKLTVNDLVAADSVIIPAQTGYLSTKGLGQIIDTIREIIRCRVNFRLKVEGILLTMVDSRTNYCKEIIRKINEEYGDQAPIFNSSIPMSVKVAESSKLGMSVYRRDPKGKASMAYEALVQEIMVNNRIGGEV